MAGLFLDLHPGSRWRTLLPQLALIAVLGVVVYYNVMWLLNTTSYGPFYEPDNYMYYKYALQLLTGLPQINTQLIGYGALPFFEHAGLYMLPATMSYVLHLPLLWSFRGLILVLIAIDFWLIYLFVHHFFEALLLPKHLEYFGLALAFLFPLILYQFEPIEWRGNLFISTIVFGMAYLFFRQYIAKGFKKKLPYLAAAALLLPVAWFMWSGWYVAVPFFILLVALSYGPDLITSKRKALYVGAGLGATIIAAFVLHAQIVSFISSVTGGFVPTCLYNPLIIGEMECLTASNGLTLVVASALIFLYAFATVWKYSIDHRRVDFYLYMLLAAGVSFLPVALVYVRAVTLLAPFLAVAFGIGYAAIQYKGGDTVVGKLLAATIAIAVVIGLLYFMYAYYTTAYVQYLIDNPSFLPAASNVLASQNGAIDLFTFYVYGDWFEANTKANVYADTVQGLNYTRIGRMDRILLSNASAACQMLETDLPVQPNYILISKMFKGFAILENASNSSVLLNPMSLSLCGYKPIYNESGTAILKR